MIGLLLSSRVVRYAIAAIAGLALLWAAVAWLRHDAVEDAKKDAKAEAHETSREIENETHGLDDDAVLDCLRGTRC